jgi:hypothetical protein
MILRLRSDSGFQPFGARSDRLTQMASPETGDAFPQKTFSPKFNGIDATRLAPTDRGQSLPARQTQNGELVAHHRLCRFDCGLCVSSHVAPEDSI